MNLKRFIAITLGVMSSIGGFFDMGEIVVTAESGARFGLSHVWVVLVGVVGIILYAEMAGRIATVTGRPVFDLVRERLGVNVGFMNLVASLLIVLLTLTAEVAGIALAFEMVTSINYLLWVPLAVLIVWLVIWIWKIKFEYMERTIGIVGMAMLVFAIAFWKLGPNWGEVLKGVFVPSVPSGEQFSTYLYFAVAIFGASMTPYEVIFYSSGAVEERWTKKDLIVNKTTAYIGFTAGGLFATSAIGVASLVLMPRGISVEELVTVSLGPAVALGKIGLALFFVGLFASTFGAALEVALSTGYCIAQFFGWRWGTMTHPRDDARFHLSIIICLLIAGLLTLTTLDPIKITELSVVFSAVALPLTYFPVFVVANDRGYLGDEVNGRALNIVGSFYLFVIVLAAVAAIPLMIWTRMGA